MNKSTTQDGGYESFFRSEVTWAGTDEILPLKQIKKHKRENWEFVYIKSGTGQIQIENDVYKANPGDLFIYPPNVNHIEISSGNETLVLKVLDVVNNYDVKFISFWPVYDKSFIKITGSWLCESYDKIITRIINETTAGEIGYTARVKAFAIEFLSLLLKYAEENKVDLHLHQTHITRSKQFIEDHYTKKVTLADIASKSYVNMFYLSHSFKKNTGYSPKDYLISIRIKKAQELLQNTDLTIKEISKTVGYDNLQHFSNTFKKRVGVSPRSFRALNNVKSIDDEESEILDK